jgi:hypothetical protein
MYYNNPFLVVDCIRFWFKLVNQIFFEMEFLKIAYFTFLSIFHLKVIVCQNFNVPHIYDQHPKKIHL